MTAAPTPRMHGIVHVHGGPDPAMIVWEALGSTAMMAALEAEPTSQTVEAAADPDTTDHDKDT